MSSYVPRPIDTSDVTLPPKLTALLEKIAENTHETWAAGRMQEGWSWGPQRDDARKQHPGLVPYVDLADSEKDYDRRTAAEALKLIVKLGFAIVPAKSGARRK
jgi:hypothetical protein